MPHFLGRAADQIDSGRRCHSAGRPAFCWHPPTAPAIDAFSATILPTAPAVKRALVISSSPEFSSSETAAMTAGSMPQAPAVGQATTCASSHSIPRLPAHKKQPSGRWGLRNASSRDRDGLHLLRRGRLPIFLYQTVLTNCIPEYRNRLFHAVPDFLTAFFALFCFCRQAMMPGSIPLYLPNQTILSENDKYTQ